MVLASDIEHLPALFSAAAPDLVVTTRLDDRDPRQVEWLKRAGGHEMLRLTTRVRVDGSSTVTLEVEPVAYQSPETDSSLDWGGLQGTFEISEQNCRIRGRIGSPHLTAHYGPAQLVMGELRFDLDGRFGSHDFFTGTQSVVIDGVRVSAPADDAAARQDLSIGRLAMQGEAHEDDASLSVSGDMKLTDLDAGGLRVSRFTLRLAADNLALAPLAELRDTVQALDTGSAQPPRDDQALQSLIQTKLMAVLAGRPRLRITELLLDTGSGTLQGNLAVRLVEPPPTDAEAPPLFWLTALEGEAHVAIAQPLLTLLATSGARATLVSGYEAAQQARPADAELDAAAADLVRIQLASLETQGVLLRRGDEFQTDIRLAQGELLINGEPLQSLQSGKPSE